MAIALTVLLWILGIILGLILLVLLVPFHVEAWGWIDADDLGGGAEARWAWGLSRFTVGGGEPMGLKVFGLRVYSPTERAEEKREKPEKKKKREEKKAKKRERKEQKKARKREARPNAMVVLREHGRTFVRMFVRLLQPFRFRVDVDGVLGLDDPGDTAMLFAMIHIVEQRSRLFNLTLQPEYLDPTAVVTVSGRLRIWLAHIGFVALRQLFYRDNRRALRAVLFPKGGK